MHFVYIIYSVSRDLYYTGESSDPHERLIKHNSGHYSDSFTNQASDWKLIFILECAHRSQAILIERHVKKMKSRTYIKNLIDYPDISNKLKNLYK